MDELKYLQYFFEGAESQPQFTRRPASIPGDYRNAWRLATLCLLLQRGRGNTLNLGHLHVLWWALRSSKTQELFLRWLEGSKSPDELLVRFDPSLTTAVNLAIGEGLAQREKRGKVRLTVEGRTFASGVDAYDEVLVAEKMFLAALPKRITQQQIRQLLEWR